mmetsp:Transcript_9349/g.10874  ORF Transcript_9349/g.10874 Transcript_9349/m.10874 type:complete len:247 (+) Transcript_9349:983-1723(+)
MSVNKLFVYGIEFNNTDRIGERTFTTGTTCSIGLFNVTFARTRFHHHWFARTASTLFDIGIGIVGTTSTTNSGTKIKMLIDWRIGRVIPSIRIRNFVRIGNSLGRQIHFGNKILIVCQGISVGSHGRMDGETTVRAYGSIERDHRNIGTKSCRREYIDFTIVAIFGSCLSTSQIHFLSRRMVFHIERSATGIDISSIIPCIDVKGLYVMISGHRSGPNISVPIRCPGIIIAIIDNRIITITCVLGT